MRRHTERCYECSPNRTDYFRRDKDWKLMSPSQAATENAVQCHSCGSNEHFDCTVDPRPPVRHRCDRLCDDPKNCVQAISWTVAAAAAAAETTLSESWCSNCGWPGHTLRDCKAAAFDATASMALRELRHDLAENDVSAAEQNVRHAQAKVSSALAIGRAESNDFAVRSQCPRQGYMHTNESVMAMSVMWQQHQQVGQRVPVLQHHLSPSVNFDRQINGQLRLSEQFNRHSIQPQTLWAGLSARSNDQTASPQWLHWQVHPHPQQMQLYQRQLLMQPQVQYQMQSTSRFRQPWLG
eukprot:SAG31_NODE_538_length_14312_cov_12.542461_17_plen_295_part_00